MVKNGTKPIVCTICGRRYGTTDACAQHRIDAHPKKAQSSNSVRAKRVSNRSKTGAPVSRSVTERSQQYDSARIKGTDRFATIEDISRHESGTVLVDKLITPGDFTRLKTVASAFQKIKYISLVFRVDPQIATATSGGYVAAVVRDPADTPPSGSALLPFLTSQNGSVTTKWWQNSTISVRDLKDRVYYTSDSVEVREYSPCRFMLAVDGKATQKGNLTVFCEWEVVLHTASYESDRNVEQVYTVLDNLFVSTGLGAAMCVRTGPDLKVAHNSTIDGAKVGDHFKLAHPFSITDESGNVRNVWYINIVSDNDIRPAFEGPEDIISGQPKVETLGILKGEILTHMPKQIFRPVVSQSPPVTPNDKKTEDTMQAFLEAFQTFVKLSKSSGSFTHLNPEHSKLGELSRSMESLQKSEVSFCINQSDIEDVPP